MHIIRTESVIHALDLQKNHGVSYWWMLREDDLIKNSTAKNYTSVIVGGN